MTDTDYVSHPIALALKKAGFDWECDHYYCAFDNETDVRFWSIHPAQSQNGLRIPKDTVVADAPTLAQAQKWLREVKELIICIEPRFYRGKRPLIGYSFHINEKENRPFTYMESEAPSNTYEEALSAGIAAALELIEKKGE